MEKLIEGGSAFDDTNDDIRDFDETDDYDLKPSEKVIFFFFFLFFFLFF